MIYFDGAKMNYDPSFIVLFLIRVVFPKKNFIKKKNFQRFQAEEKGNSVKTSIFFLNISNVVF